VQKKKQQLRQWLAAGNVKFADVAAREEAARVLAPVGARTLLRNLLRRCGLPLDPRVEGVRQDSLAEAARTLCAWSGACPDDPRAARRIVIEAKDHARLALPRLASEEARQLRAELIEWMVVWVNDPPLFPAWVKLRPARLSGERNQAGQ